MSPRSLGPDFPPHRPLTMREFLRVDNAREDRHEYVAGEVFRRPDPSLRHATIAGNLLAAFHRVVLADGGVLLHAFKLRVGRAVVYYPDLMVTYAPMRDSATVAREARLVIEVASPGTALTDGREKLAAYRGLRSLRCYLVVDEVQRRVDRYWRDDTSAARWKWEEIVGDGDVNVPCPPWSLDLDHIYERVDRPEHVGAARDNPPVRVLPPGLAPA